VAVSGFNRSRGLVPYWLFQPACCSTAKTLTTSKVDIEQVS